MRRLKILKNKRIKRVGFLGIGGISMSALAEYALNSGYEVYGADRKNSEITERLKGKGAVIDASKISGCDALVYTSAIPKNDERLIYFKKRNRAIRRSEFLGEILSLHKNAICVSGTHGKTTATALVAHILICAGLHPTVFLGGEDLDFGNLLIGGKEYAVAEACEFEKNFLDLKPTLSVILNIDSDHKGSFLGFEDQKFAFTRFAGGSLAVINADDKAASEIKTQKTITFGINNPADYLAKRITEGDDGISFTAYKSGRRLFRARLKIKGVHNVLNALSAIAVADALSIPLTAIENGLSRFKGVKRRAERIGEINGATVIADYAHHPREIAATLNSLGGNEKDALVIFQPHTFSRTKDLLPEFIESLSGVKNLIIYKTYPAREKYDKNGSAITLYRAIKKIKPTAEYIKSENGLNTALLVNKKGVKTVLVLGAGDIYDIARKIIEKNGEKCAFSLAKKRE